MLGSAKRKDSSKLAGTTVTITPRYEFADNFCVSGCKWECLSKQFDCLCNFFANNERKKKYITYIRYHNTYVLTSRFVTYSVECRTFLCIKSEYDVFALLYTYNSWLESSIWVYLLAISSLKHTCNRNLRRQFVAPSRLERYLYDPEKCIAAVANNRTSVTSNT